MPAALSSSDSPLAGAAALVTGASQGIGLAIASRLGRMGARVAICARDAAKLEAAAQRLKRDGIEALATVADVRQPSSIETLLERTLEKFGPVDILVNNAGTAVFGPFHQFAEADWDEVLDTNLKAVFLLCRAVAPEMMKRRTGHIINIASLAGKNAFAGGGIYCASKWGLLGLTQCMAEDLRAHGIRVSAVCPGSVATDFSPHPGKDSSKMLQADDIAHAVAMLVTQAPQSFISEISIRPTQKPSRKRTFLAGLRNDWPRVSSKRWGEKQMKKSNAVILVTGATGKQGGAAARQLLARGWRIRALVRNPQKPEAQALLRRGAELVQGDLDDRVSIDRALEGATGVFSVQNFWETGAEREITQGTALADASRAARVEHFIYSSVGGADRRSGLSHFESKWKIEQHIRALGLPHTIFRPVFFMDNFEAAAIRSAILKGELAMGISPTRTLQMIAVEDIGVFVALAFERPQEFLGQALEIAGDELTMPKAAEILSKVVGRPVRFVQQPIEQVRGFSKEYAEMYEWFEAHGYKADIPALRKLHPDLMTFEQWARKGNWASVSA